MPEYKPKELAADREPWMQQPNETPKAFAAFNVYRDLKPNKRTLAAAAAEGDFSRGTVGQWARKWFWTQRVSEWDAHQDELRREKDQEAIDQMREQHIKIGKMITALGAGELAKHLKESQQEGKPILDAKTATHIAEKGLRIERLNRGEPETIKEEIGRVNMTWTEIVAKRNLEDSDMGFDEDDDEE